MRFPKIDDVAAELRRINKMDTDEDDIDVRLQVYSDGDWAVRWGLSDYDQDHRGYWGSSGVPGGNRRFDSKAVARDLIDQAKEAKAMGGDDEGLDEAPAAKVGEGHTTEIVIPEMDWTQISGDMDPGQYGAIIATGDGSALELIEIQPVREYVGNKDAADVGFPFWSKEAYYTLEDLDPEDEDVQKALESMDLDISNMAPPQRAIIIAEALMRYGVGSDEGPAGWSQDVLGDRKVKWWTGAVAGAEYIADEDEEFRREILGEEDEETEEDEEE